jgi:hypothetical protein
VIRREPALVAASLVLTGCSSTPGVECVTSEDCGGVQSCVAARCVFPEELGLTDGGAGANAGRYVDQGDGTVLDRSTGLFWIQVAPVSVYDWQGATDSCAGLAYAGSLEWRSPTYEELRGILSGPSGGGGEYTGGCYWNSLFQGDCRTYPYWSSSETSATNAMRVGFYLGTLRDSAKTTACHVRCVRGP